MKISILNFSLSALAFGFVFMGHFGFGASTEESYAAPDVHEPEREAVARLGPSAGHVEKELEQLELQMEAKEVLTMAEYQDVQSGIDELLGQLNEKVKTEGYADAELFRALLKLQDKVAGMDVY